jgi:hypothetical protein
MSSHHVVREGQEPALFILDPVSFELASPFLEWAPMVLVSDNALDTVLKWGIKIDAVLTDIDREEIVAAKIATQMPVEIIPLMAEEPLVKHALHYLIGRKQSGVNVLASRPEEIFSPAEIVLKQLNVSIMDENLRWSGISTGRFEKWVMVNSVISIRKSNDSQSMEVKGLIERDGCFESTGEGMISIRSDRFFWVAESYA